MRILYSLLLYLLTPVVLLRLLWRSFRAPAYRRRWAERFGFFTAPQLKQVIWVHAVSVGEVQAALPMIQHLQGVYPDHDLVVTTMTPTGSERVQKLFGDEVFHVYAPYDLPCAVSRFMRRIQPRIAIVMETEVWPNLFHACHARGVPIVLANARLSEKSYLGYRKIARLSRPALQKISCIAAQEEADAARFKQLGVADGQIQVTGSIKFDINISASLREEAQALRRLLGNGRAIWIAASTHEGEEEQVLEACEQIRKSIPDALLILVPRHPDRFNRVASLCEKQGFRFARRSENELCSPETEIYLGDTLGELLLLYAASDVAFVGGSLVNVGGHNLLEPAALGIASVIGPISYNFAEITRRLLELGGSLQVSDAEQLAATIELLLRDANLRHAMGEKARGFVEQNRGALNQLNKIIADTLLKS